MQWREKRTLRDGTPITLRSFCTDDASAACELFRKVCAETENLLREPEECTITVQQEADYIERQRANPRALALGAFVGEQLVGMGSFQPVAAVSRTRHRLNFGVSVLKDWWGRGVATAIMRSCIMAAQQTGAEQMELEVVNTNDRAIALYKRAGFVKSGIIVHALKYRDGRYADFLLMQRRLNPVRGEGDAEEN